MAAHKGTALPRDGRHLCDDAIETIERIAADTNVAVTLDQIDVDDQPRLADE